MSYISLIKKYGLVYFIKTAYGELRKRLFIWSAKVLYRRPGKISFSQYGEDLYIDRVLGYRETGVYVDIGANHPSALSNTKIFYDRGWTGINVEPNYNNYLLFIKERQRDINVNAGIADKAGMLTFYEFDPHTLSTFSSQGSKKLQDEGYKLLQEKKVEVVTLKTLFENYKLGKIDFMSVDTEGYNMLVLQGNDWNKFRPKLLCVEIESGKSYDDFLKQVGYKKVSSNGLNSFFLDERS